MHVNIWALPVTIQKSCSCILLISKVPIKMSTKKYPWTSKVPLHINMLWRWTITMVAVPSWLCRASFAGSVFKQFFCVYVLLRFYSNIFCTCTSACNLMKPQYLDFGSIIFAPLWMIWKHTSRTQLYCKRFELKIEHIYFLSDVLFCWRLHDRNISYFHFAFFFASLTRHKWVWVI